MYKVFPKKVDNNNIIVVEKTNFSTIARGEFKKTGAGKHQSSKQKRVRTRNAQNRKAIGEFS